MDYKHSYKGLFVFLAIHFSALIGVGIISVWKDFIPLLFIANVITIGMTILMYIIYKTEYIYWMNGVEYEKALIVGSRRRKEFARKHLERMGKAAIFGLIITFISIIFGLSQFIAFPIIFINFIVICISTVNIEL